MRYLAVDLGEARTGLAVGDDETGLVSALTTIEIPAKRRDDLLDAIAKAADDQGADALVVGLPLNMDGSEGGAAKKARDFGQALGERAGLAVHFQDERLTSAAADWTMAQSGLTHKQKKARRDALAAAAVLRDFLQAHDDE